MAREASSVALSNTGSNEESGAFVGSGCSLKIESSRLIGSPVRIPVVSTAVSTMERSACAIEG